MRNKILSILLSALLIICMCPVEMFAAETPTYVNNATLVSTINNAQDNVETTIRLNENINLNGILSIPSNKKIVLDLYGYNINRTLEQATADGRIIDVSGELTIKNTSEDARESCISGGKTKTDLGACIYVSSDATFNFDGGQIKNNFSTQNGGAVYVDTNATFNMSGGYISNNIASADGGAVYMDTSAEFNMSGGTITKNFASADGGAVYVGANASLNLSKTGVIDSNTAVSDGGGVYVDIDGTFNADNIYKLDFGAANIRGNSAINGGGVYVAENANVELNDIFIFQNTDRDVYAKNSFVIGGKTCIGNSFLCGHSTIDVSKDDPLVMSKGAFNYLIDTDTPEDEHVLVTNAPADMKNEFKPADDENDYISFMYKSDTKEICWLNAYTIRNFSDLWKAMVLSDEAFDTTKVSILLDGDMNWLAPVEIPQELDVKIYMNGNTIRNIEHNDTTITLGNKKYPIKNGCIFKNNGRLVLNNGTIVDANNKEAGGAIISNGDTILENMTIKDNKSTAGSGVLVTDGGSLKLCGKTVIKDNKNPYGRQNNVLLSGDAIIRISSDAPLLPGSMIGISSMLNKDSIIAVDGAKEDELDYFVSDSNQKSLVFDIDHINLVGNEISKDGSKTVANLTGETDIDRTTRDTVTKLDLTNSTDRLFKAYNDNNSTELRIDLSLPTSEYINKTMIVMPKDLVVGLYSSAGFKNIIFNTNLGEFTLNAACLNEMLSTDGRSFKLQITKSNPDADDLSQDAYDIKLFSLVDGVETSVNKFDNGTLTAVVSIPQGLTRNTVACVTKSNNKIEKMLSLSSGNVSGTVKFATKELNKFYLVKQSVANKGIAANTATKLSSVKAYKGRKIKLTFSRVKALNTKFTKYQIYRSTSSKFNKNLKKYTVINKKTSSTITYTNKGLKKGKRYYYKVRGVASVNGTTVYTKWSTVKSVKAK